MIRRALALLSLAAGMSGCVLTPDQPPVQTLIDQQTAVTVETTGEPYVLACAAGGMAANARDYLDLRVLESDRMGKRAYYLSLVAFTTVDRRGVANPTAQGLEQVRLNVGHKTIDLVALPAGDDAHGLSVRLYPRRNGQVAAAEYVVSPDLIRDLAAASEADISVDVGSGGDLRYEPWMPSAQGLKAFADRLPRSGR